MSVSEWYQGGLRFECTQCGACCTGRPGYVLFTDDEAAAIADRLGISIETFYKKYTHDTDAGRSLTEHETEFGFDCVFLDRETTPGASLCSIHDLRPTQCRTFPFWPEHLRTKREWEKLGNECEGVNRGPMIPIEAIRIDRDKKDS